MKLLLSIMLAALFSISVTGQETINRNELTVKFGFSHTAIQDSRISAITQSAWSPKYGVSYRKINHERISQIDFHFTQARSDNNTLLGMVSIIPQVSYSYLRKTKNGLWLGGFLDHTTLLNFPKTSSGLYNNNPINYLLTASIGPSFAYDKSEIFGIQKMRFDSKFQTPILSYVIQPEFGHPYPKKYLEHDTFSPTRSGLAGPLLKSGRVVSINKFRSLNISLGFHYQVSDKVDLSLNLNTQLLYANTTNKSLSMNNYDVLFGASYIH